jgi:sRNA-binding carbon storage regulator CsrA
MSERTCVVVSIRDSKEHLTLLTDQGEIHIHTVPSGSNKVRVRVYAPKSVTIRRTKKAAEPQEA